MEKCERVSLIRTRLAAMPEDGLDRFALRMRDCSASGARLLFHGSDLPGHGIITEGKSILKMASTESAVEAYPTMSFGWRNVAGTKCQPAQMVWWGDPSGPRTVPPGLPACSHPNPGVNPEGQSVRVSESVDWVDPLPAAPE